jgi:hypothetical protein
VSRKQHRKTQKSLDVFDALQIKMFSHRTSTDENKIYFSLRIL